MMMVAAALLMAQAGAPPPGPPILVGRAKTSTEVAMTRDAFDLDCSLIDPSMKRFALAVEQRGGRGYVDPRSDDPDTRFRSTALSFRILRDETRLFRDGKLNGQDIGGPVDRLETRDPKFGVVRLETFPIGRGWDVAAVVYVNGSSPGHKGFVKYTGFCSVARHAQLPLTEAEAAKVVRQ
ncbi:MAG: hypothetical protein E6G94_11995 [Alphaproteobacteria bacterium]|nr:MAG: hypothetical protein E6G94_11995 [Alphaproteobacteria bacterium]